jgi:nucleotide-binding universal stress UspA family protein
VAAVSSADELRNRVRRARFLDAPVRCGRTIEEKGAHAGRTNGGRISEMARDDRTREMSTILLAVSTETCIEHVVPVAAAMATRFDAEVVVFHVREWPFNGSDWVLGGAGLVEDKSEAAQILNDALSRLHAAGVRARGIIAGGRPADIAKEIVDAAGDEDADLIVIGAHRHSTLYELFVGGIPRRVRRLAEVPVVIVPRRTPMSTWRERRVHAPRPDAIASERGGARDGLNQPTQA